MTERQMAEVLQEINRRLDKLDKLEVAVARLEEQVKALPPVPVQPCETLKEHLREAKEHAGDWRKALINGAVRIALAILLFAAGYIWTKESSGCPPTATPAKTVAPSSNSTTP